MRIYVKKIAKLSTIMIKEQIKEPVALIWTLLSPSLMFYFILLSQDPNASSSGSRINYVAWTYYYYAYVAASVAFFGFAFYLIGRRESGFLRSFAYQPAARSILLISQLFAYSIIAAFYCISFYLLTRPFFGTYDASEFLNILMRFYVVFCMFCSGALILVLLPLTFQNANTLFSILLFSMLAMLVAARLAPYETVRIANKFNPLTLANSIMSMDRASLIGTGALMILFLMFMIRIAARSMPVNPVWSRY